MSPPVARPSYAARDEEISLFEDNDVMNASHIGLLDSGLLDQEKQRLEVQQQLQQATLRGREGSAYALNKPIINSGEKQRHLNAHVTNGHIPPEDTSSNKPAGQQQQQAFEPLVSKITKPTIPDGERIEQKIIRAQLQNGVSQFMRHVEGGLQCTLCDRHFAWQNSLVRHITCVHAGIKNFECNRCGKSFKGRHGLKYHTDAESCLKIRGPGSRRQFKSLANMNARPHSKKGFGDFPCTICGKRFLRQKIMTRHIKTVHDSVDAFKCPMCPKAFKSKQGLQYHTSRAHDKNALETRFQPQGGLLSGNSNVTSTTAPQLTSTSFNPLGEYNYTSASNNNNNNNISNNSTTNNINNNNNLASINNMFTGSNHQHYASANGANSQSINYHQQLDQQQQRLRQAHSSSPFAPSHNSGSAANPSNNGMVNHTNILPFFNNSSSWVSMQASIIAAARRNSYTDQGNGRRNSFSELLPFPLEFQDSAYAQNPIEVSQLIE